VSSTTSKARDRCVKLTLGCDVPNEKPRPSLEDRGFLLSGSKQGRRCRAIPKLILAHLDGAPMRGDEMSRLQMSPHWQRPLNGRRFRIGSNTGQWSGLSAKWKALARHIATPTGASASGRP
jgi:hypothetical protein